MKLSYSAGLAVRNLSRSKLRTWLTIIGIIIGVSSVVIILSLGSSLESGVASKLSGLGADEIYFVPGSPMANSGGSGAYAPSAISTLNANDLTAIRLAPNVLYTNTGVTGTATLVYRNQYDSVEVEGIDPHYYFLFNSDTLESGSMFDSSSTDQVVLGYDVANTLFDTQIPLNSQVSIGGKFYRVVGILNEEGTPLGDDSAILISEAGARDILTGYSDTEYSFIEVKVADTTIINQTVNDLTDRLLNERHETRSQQDFTVIAASSILGIITGVIGGISLFLALIAAVSLLVSTIGIANTMFMTVLERTRQIGIYKALGATNWEIGLLFMIESSLLGLVGGVIGVLISIGICGAISSVTASSGLGFAITVGNWTIFLALLFSTLLGAAAGYFPSRQAAKLRPVEALRFD